jgi:hypothetical protein
LGSGVLAGIYEGRGSSAPACGAAITEASACYPDPENGRNRQGLLENGSGAVLAAGFTALHAAWKATMKRNPTKAEEQKIEKAVESMLIKPSDAKLRAYVGNRQSIDWAASGARKSAPKKVAPSKKRWTGIAMKKSAGYW